LGEILVGLSAEGLEPRLAPSGCPRCTGRLRRALLAYNQRRDPATLDGLECPCRLGYY
jgi:uncharacterized Fe-S cluster-containing MiaB family protein